MHADGANGEDDAVAGGFGGGGGFGAEAANGEAGTGEGMAREELSRDTKLSANFANFIFVKRGEGFDDAAGVDQRLDAGDAVVMGLDEIGFGGAAGFDGIGIDGALTEDPVAVQEVFRGEDAFLHLDELLTDRAALGFGFGEAFSAARNSGSAESTAKCLAPSSSKMERTSSVSPARMRPVST